MHSNDLPEDTFAFDVIADGIATVNLVSVTFTDEIDASTANLEAANLSPSALNMIICKREYGVSMSEIFVGRSTLWKERTIRFQKQTMMVNILILM